MTFSKAIWNSGVVHRGNVVVLMVTLDKGELLPDHQYADHFLSTDKFQWQSQNQTSQSSTFGQILRHHQVKGLDVHLFVRREKKANGISQPFIYCGKVIFESWEQEKPITVNWRLEQPLSSDVMSAFSR